MACFIRLLNIQLNWCCQENLKSFSSPGDMLVSYDEYANASIFLLNMRIIPSLSSTYEKGWAFLSPCVLQGIGVCVGVCLVCIYFQWLV